MENIQIKRPRNQRRNSVEKEHDREAKDKIRVAAYCRVSTDSDQQEMSFETQVEVYQKKISENPDWEFAGVYSDEGITGTKAEARPGFQKMIKDAYADASKMLEENREILDRISDHLYEKETITGKEFMKIFREMKGLSDPEEEKKAAGAASDSAGQTDAQSDESQVSDVIYVEPTSDADVEEEEHGV